MLRSRFGFRHNIHSPPFTTNLHSNPKHMHVPPPSTNGRNNIRYGGQSPGIFDSHITTSLKDIPVLSTFVFYIKEVGSIGLQISVMCL